MTDYSAKGFIHHSELSKSNELAIKFFGTPLISKEQAISKDLMFYKSDSKCVNGHDTFKYTHSDECMECVKQAKRIADGLVNPEVDKQLAKVKKRKDDLMYQRELGKLLDEF